ncbi:MAG: hypothetical protein WCX82_01035 [archaeon]|jgi:hypothetical protein
MIAKKIITVFTILFLIIFITNVFAAYQTKPNLESSTKTFARDKGINYIEISPFTGNDLKDTTVYAKKDGGCEVTVALNKNYSNLVVSAEGNIKFMPHILVSVPLKDKTVYFSDLDYFVNKEKTNRARSETRANQRFLYKPEDFYSEEITFDVSDSVCNKNKTTMDIVVFIPTKPYNAFDNQDNVYVRNYSPIGNGLGDYLTEYDLVHDKSDILTLINLAISQKKTNLYNLDFAFEVDVNKSKLTEVTTPQSNKNITQTGNDYLPAGTITPRVDRRFPPTYASNYTNSDIIRYKHVILNTEIIIKNKNAATTVENVDPLKVDVFPNEVAVADATDVAIDSLTPVKDIACELEVNLVNLLSDYSVISPTEMYFLVSLAPNLRSTYPGLMNNLVKNSIKPSGKILALTSKDYDKIYTTQNNSRIITGYNLKIPRSSSNLCNPQTIDVYAFMPIERSSHELVIYSTETKVFGYHRYSSGSKILEELKETELNTNSPFLYSLNSKPTTSSQDYYNYNLDFLYDIRTREVTVTSNIQTINGGICPGSCGEGYFSSKYYPRNMNVGNLIYNGVGAICYSCSPGDAAATRCDPRTGNAVGTLDLSTAAGQIIKQELCPDIDINVELPPIDIKDLPIEPVTITPIEPKLQEIGQLYEVGTGMFDCDTLETATLQERLSLSYNNDNANYYSSNNTTKYSTLTYSNSVVDINILKLFLSSKYNFKQISNYATACFIETIDLPELQNPKNYILAGSGTIVNGDVISKLTVLADGKKIEVCINRPIDLLNDTERIIENKPFLENNLVKTFSIKQKRWYWFDKKVKDITFTLNADLKAFGCSKKLISSENHSSLSKFITSSTGDTGNCYNPQGTDNTGLTGKINQEKYGFNKLLFIYDADGIKHNSCDYGEKYCDQDQLKVALLEKVKLIEEQKIITLDGVMFSKSEENKINENSDIYLTDIRNDIQVANLITSDFSYSEDPDVYLETLITTLNKVPEELRKYIILDLTFTNKNDSIIGTKIELNEISERINKISGNNNYKYLTYLTTESNAKRDMTSPMQDIYTYQITVDSFLKNQASFKTYLNNTSTDLDFKRKNIVFLKQVIENMKIYYGDSISPILVNTKTYGSLTNGLTKDIFTSIQFLNESNKPIALLNTSEVQEISGPGLYLFELKLEGTNIKYSVKNTSEDTKRFLDYYNMDSNPDYKKNLLFTNPINAIYTNYYGVPFKFNDSAMGAISGNAYAPTTYEDWAAVQDGYVLSFKSTGTQIEKISYKNIRPIQIISAGNYNYKYLKPNGSYNEPVINKTAGKETVFVYLNFRGNNPQLVLTSRDELQLNMSLTPEINANIKSYNIPNNLETENQELIDFEDLFSGIETVNVGYMLGLIKYNQVCFNTTNDSLNIWLNPEKIKKLNLQAPTFRANTSNNYLNLEIINPNNNSESRIYWNNDNQDTWYWCSAYENNICRIHMGDINSAENKKLFAKVCLLNSDPEKCSNVSEYNFSNIN